MTSAASGALEDASYLLRIAELEARLREAEETLEAIRSGEVDAVIVGHSDAQRVYTIETADRPYRALIEQMQEGAVTLSADCTVLYCNRRLAEILETPQERVTGSSILQFVPVQQQEAFDHLLTESGGGGGKSEFTLTTGHGSVVPVTISLVDLAGDGKRVLCGIVTDLTQQKQRMSELTDTNRRLATEIEERAHAEGLLRQAQKMEAVGQLTGGLAHDFNNLLTVILGNLERAQARVTDEKLARQIDHARQAAERGAGLTRQLLAFSRTQSLTSKSVSIAELFPGLELLVRRAIGEQVELEMVGADGLWNCQADPNQIESAVLNLAINARDAMPDGGVLTIAASNIELSAADTATNSELMPGRYVMISVADTGEGMTSATMAKVFEPFFTTKDVGKGSGLGLSMVYGFVRQSNGHVTIESEVGQGTTICLYLPWAENVRVEEVSTVSEAVELSRSVVVLVVEDDPYVRLLVVQLVADLGHDVLEAEDGPDALRMLERRPDIELLFSDVVMPKGMSGIDLAHEARRRRPDIAVLLTSGHTRQSLAQAAGGNEKYRIIRKPYRHDVLAETINAALAEVQDRQQPIEYEMPSLKGKRLLVVEDDPFISMMLEDILNGFECEITGPVMHLDEALKLASEGEFDAALLDVSIGERFVYPVADQLLERRVPFAFMTGYDSRNLPEAYRDHASLPKPYTEGDVESVLNNLLQIRRSRKQ